MQRRISDKYELGRQLNEGTYGVIYMCTERKTGESFACKSINKNKPLHGVADIRREISIMSMLPNHPNIVGLKEVYEDKDTVYLVMELCKGGELYDRLVQKKHYSEPEAAHIIRIVVEAIEMCHKCGIMHRDVKAENMLFANDSEDAELKLIDFGYSVVFEPGQRFTDVVGTLGYLAPEMLRRNYGPEVDIWSAGVILYALLSGFRPFDGETTQGIIKNTLKGKIDLKTHPWPEISENAKNLVSRMLERDPERRLTAQQILGHPWLQKRW